MMHNGEPITQLLPTMKAFPESSDIFIPEQAWLANHFLPLLSIDLGELRPDLAGTVVHMLSPFEPYDGHIGERTTDYHTKYCGENFYAFRLNSDNRYEFLADEGYFLRSAIHKGELWEHAYIQEKIATYAESKERFKQTGKLTKKYGNTLKEQSFLDALGGSPEPDNWCSSFEIWDDAFLPPEIIEASYANNPLKNSHFKYHDCKVDFSCHGKPCLFIGKTTGYNWCNGGADGILMFYEPHNRIVLFTLNFG